MKKTRNDSPMTPTRIIARHRPEVRATLSDLRELRFPSAAPADDLPADIRSASGIRQWQQYFAIVQDDVHAIALLERATGALSSVLLPRGADGRRVFGDSTGNKALKMDLEACAVLPDGRFLALGSGSAPVRECLVLLSGDLEVRVIEARDFYAQLHARQDFSGSELNLEGAEVLEDRLRLFQRGNGAPRGELSPINAFADIAIGEFLGWLEGGSLPKLGPATQVELGEVGGVGFDFTDVARLPDGRVAFLAAAEDSPDAYQDGANLGCRFGVLDGNRAWTADIHDETGVQSNLKFEGIEYQTTHDDGRLEFVVVADMDDPTSPAPIARLSVAMG